MKTLNLYKERDYTEVILSDKNVYKLPNDYNVEEAERILEKQIEIEALANTEIDDEKPEAVKEVQRFWSLVFAQLEILFQHYQPEITAEKLKVLLTQKQALDIIGFHKTNKFGAEVSEDTETTKKKI